MLVNLKAGDVLGPYEILAPVGAGGMGEVFRAKDSRLGREVAIKVLPAEYSSDPDRLRRFEQEAKAAGLLNHPNILSVYDIGTHEGCPYVVSELLVGETLRDRIGGTPVSTRKLIDYALQIAHGLGAAHEKGIVHRDLKPENIFLTRDGRVKILDFGLAKLTVPEPVSGGKSQLATREVGTQPGMVLGTVGYMSPEQVRGREVDHRSDLFSFGAILYEMATGKRAFQRDSTADTMSAILKEDPVDPSSTNKSFPPALERIIRHCLEKNAEERFQSARDLAFDLETMSGVSSASVTGQAVAVDEPKRRKVPGVFAPLLLFVGILIGAGAMFWVMRAKIGGEAAQYQRLTFGRGFVTAARFAPDRQTVIYSANWSGADSDLFSTRPQAPVSRSLNLPKAHLLSISSTGEMAILMDASYLNGWMRTGTLARVPIDGGGAREVLDNVQDADWSPDGSQLAVIRNTPTKRRIEYPIGKVIYETNGWLSNIRVSRDGHKIALMEHAQLADDRGIVIVMDTEGKKKVLTEEWASESGLAWSPKDDEIWFSASLGGSNLSPLRAVTLDGKQRIISSIAGNLVLADVSSDGQVLVSQDNRRREMIGRGPGQEKERELSWMDWSFPRDFTKDGKSLLFEEEGAGGGQNYSVYMRGMDGSAAVRLGEGYGIALSPDDQTALSRIPGGDVTLLPTGAGQPKKLKWDFNANAFRGAEWMPDGKTLLVRAEGKSTGQPRAWLYDIETAQMRPLTPEGVANEVLSSDAKFVVAKCIDGGSCTYKIPGGEMEKVTGLKDDDQVIGPALDPQWFYVTDRDLLGQLTRKVDLVNIFTGERKLWKEITPPDIAGVVPPINIRVFPDGTSYVYTYKRVLTDLYLAKGLQ